MPVSQFGGVSYPTTTSQQGSHHPSTMAPPNTFGQPLGYNQTAQFGLYPMQNNPFPSSRSLQPSTSGLQRNSPTQASEPQRPATPAYDPYARPPGAPRPPERTPSPIRNALNNFSNLNSGLEDIDSFLQEQRGSPNPHR
ncbi:hypothetical protein [Xenorhabdus mauleonii]|uniref:hypothetical protein n=1 Tax=Xenorhabdus mauleonii TaxID=351675 RepID=UPI001113529F|nr:hypothetical protein [Xenorhabdus mauleonii]